MCAASPVVRVVIIAFPKQRKCKSTGTIPSDGIVCEEEEVTSLMFLGAAVKMVQEKVVMHRGQHLEVTL
eukprot:10621469-Prorocentrum_lima.AAC.1